MRAIKHSCGHQAEHDIPDGPEGAGPRAWLRTRPCPTCQANPQPAPDTVTLLAALLQRWVDEWGEFDAHDSPADNLTSESLAALVRAKAETQEP